MTALLYHSNGSDAETSPFDDAVLRVAHGSDIKIVSPYIGLRYLQRLIDASNSWALVSDIEAWLSALSISERAKALIFIHAHLEKIHHFPAIHAKTVISPKLAYLGSANLTSMGILNRTEMGVLLEDIRLVDELNRWFDGLWIQTGPPDVNEISEFVYWLDQQAQAAVAAPPKKSLSSGVKKVRAHLVNRDGMVGPIVGPKKNAAAEPAEQMRKEYANPPLAIVDINEPGVVVSLIDQLVAKGFDFEAFVHAARRHGCQQERQRDLYLALLPFCANHPRSVFEVDTINRLLIVAGKFVQSTSTLLTPHQAPFDEYLSHLVLALSFEEARELPSCAQMFELTGLRDAHQHHLIKSLLESGLLVQAENTRDSQARYTLKKKFAWSRRFQLFSKSYRSWTKGLSQAATDYAASQISIAKALNNPNISVQPVEMGTAIALDNPATLVRPIKPWPLLKNTKAAEDSDSLSFLLENIDEIIAPSEPLTRAATRIIRPSNRLALGDAIKPIFLSDANRIDELYLQLAKILEPSTGFFNFKSIESFAMYIYAHYREDKEFIEKVLIGNIDKIKLFDISIDWRKTVRSCKVEVNLNADMSEYPKTYRFMKESAEVWQRELSKNKKRLFRLKSKPGFFERTVGHAALSRCDPVKKSIELKKEKALIKKALAKVEGAKPNASVARQAYLDDSTLKAIKEAYARFDRADKIFESLLFFVQLYGNKIPLESEIEVFKKISDRTNIRLKEVERIFKNETNPFTLSILKASAEDTETSCFIQLNHSYSGNLEVLPKTKKLLDISSLN